MEFPGEMEFQGIVMKFEFYMEKHLGIQNGTTFQIKSTTLNNCVTMFSQ
jgi:hypothetical protein